MKKLLALLFALALTISMSSFAIAQDTMGGSTDKKTDTSKTKKSKKTKKDKKSDSKTTDAGSK
jgi:uncharacterized protein YxeA